MSVQKSPILRVPEQPTYEGIQGQIDRLNTVKGYIRDAIASKGAAIPDSVKMEDLPSYVYDIVQVDTYDATANASDIMKGKTAYVKGLKVTGTKEVKLQTKTIAPATYEKNAYPDDGYDGLSKVTVSAIPTVLQGTPVITVSEAGLITAKATQNPGYVNSGSKSSTQQLDTQAAKTITPTTSSQTAVAKNVYTTGEVTVAGDANLKAENIANGVSIFGVTGTLDAPNLSWTFNDTIDAASCPETDIDFYCPQLSTVTYNTIKYGTQPLASLNYVSGNNATTCAYIVDSTTWMENAKHIVFTEPPTGALLTWLKVNATSNSLSFSNKSVTITSNGTTTIMPDSPHDALSSVGVTVNVPGMAAYVGTFTPTDKLNYITITHNLGRIPTCVMAGVKGWGNQTSDTFVNGFSYFNANTLYSVGNTYGTNTPYFTTRTASSICNSSSAVFKVVTADETIIKIGSSSHWQLTTHNIIVI